MPTLRALLEQPLMREAFARHAQGHLPWSVRVPLTQEPALEAAHAAAAFAYLIQMEIAGWRPPAGCEVAQTGWLAQIGLHNLAQRAATRVHALTWQTWMSQFLPAINGHVQGQSMPFRQRAIGAWRLALLDTLCRSPLSRPAAFVSLPTPEPAQVRQLARWMHRWKNIWFHLPVPANRVWIHPDLAAGGQVTQAEADLILDDQVVAWRALGGEINGPAVRLLAGQAAWARLVGVHGVNERLAPSSLGIGLIRAPAGHRWQTIALTDLFPGKGWDSYCRALAQAARL